MNLNIKESYEKALDEIDILEFELEDSAEFEQRLTGVSQIIKKLFLRDMLKLMQPIADQLGEAELTEFRSIYREWISKTDAVARLIRNGSRLDCNDDNLVIIEKFLPCIKGNIKGITLYKKSRQIQIAV